MIFLKSRVFGKFPAGGPGRINLPEIPFQRHSFFESLSGLAERVGSVASIPVVQGKNF
jgi:hypothetical protein